MESLNTLASSLTTTSPRSLAEAEKELMNNFKAAALSITTLYRSSRHTSKRAFNAGYASACQDLLMMIQQGVSDGGISAPGATSGSEGPGMTVGKVMDWLEARLDAIKSREEEEEEDEEREKELQRARTAPVVPLSRPRQRSDTPPSPVEKPKPIPRSVSPAQALLPLQPLQRTPRSHHNSMNPKDHAFPIASTSSASPDIPFALVPSEPTVAEISAGSKRRHGLMMMLDSSAASPLSMHAPAGSSHASTSTVARRRTRSTRGLPPGRAHHDQNQHQLLTESMDVEEDGGRERKRVARR